jgi:hypothetical protein
LCFSQHCRAAIIRRLVISAIVLCARTTFTSSPMDRTSSALRWWRWTKAMVPTIISTFTQKRMKSKRKTSPRIIAILLPASAKSNRGCHWFVAKSIQCLGRSFISPKSARRPFQALLSHSTEVEIQDQSSLVNSIPWLCQAGAEIEGCLRGLKRNLRASKSQ